jgi:hypothetical protein
MFRDWSSDFLQSRLSGDRPDRSFTVLQVSGRTDELSSRESSGCTRDGRFLEDTKEKGRK